MPCPAQTIHHYIFTMMHAADDDEEGICLHIFESFSIIIVLHDFSIFFIINSSSHTWQIYSPFGGFGTNFARFDHISTDIFCTQYISCFTLVEEVDKEKNSNYNFKRRKYRKKIYFSLRFKCDRK